MELAFLFPFPISENLIRNKISPSENLRVPASLYPANNYYYLKIMLNILKDIYYLFMTLSYLLYNKKLLYKAFYIKISDLGLDSF